MASTNLFSSLRRLQNFPIDSTNQYATLEELSRYVSSSRLAYPGQLLSVYNDGDNNGVYFIYINNGNLSYFNINSSIVQLENAFNTLQENMGGTVTELETMIEHLDTLTNSFATKDEFRELIGEEIDNIAEINGAVDTINEIKVWIAENETVISTILGIKEEMKTFATKEELQNIDIANIDRISTFTFGVNAENQSQIIKAGSLIKTITITITNKAIEDLENTISLKINGSTNSKLIDLSKIDFSENLEVDTLTNTYGNTYTFDLNYRVSSDSYIYIECDNLKGAAGIISLCIAI